LKFSPGATKFEPTILGLFNDSISNALPLLANRTFQMSMAIKQHEVDTNAGKQMS
jgi:hypothetical protein